MVSTLLHTFNRRCEWARSRSDELGGTATSYTSQPELDRNDRRVIPDMHN